MTIPSRSVNTTAALLFDGVFDSPVDSQVNEDIFFKRFPSRVNAITKQKYRVGYMKKEKKVIIENC